MQYHLDTIPVWAVMERHLPCPLCGLADKTEQEEIERTLGAGVMEPAVRIHFNERGVCARHQQLLYGAQNRLGHALLMDSHAKEQLKALEAARHSLDTSGHKLKRLFARTSPVEQALRTLRTLGSKCAVCEAVETHMARYRATFLHLWKTDANFRAAWHQSQGVCLPHAVALLECACGCLNRAQQLAFASETLAFLTDRLAADEQDLDLFTRKFDYRNRDLPWGESKTALERVVNRLRGRCLGDLSKLAVEAPAAECSDRKSLPG